MTKTYLIALVSMPVWVALAYFKVMPAWAALAMVYFALADMARRSTNKKIIDKKIEIKSDRSVHRFI